MQSNTATPSLHHAHEAYAAPRLMRLPEVLRLISLSRSSIYELIAAGRFPRPVPLTTTARAWVEAEVLAWAADRIAERDAGQQ